jgi:hypothetical protein
MTSIHDRVARWVLGVLVDCPPEGPYAKLELWRSSADAQPLLLDTVHLTSEKQRGPVTNATYAYDLATHFVDTLKQEADSQAPTGGGAYQRGALLAYRAEASEATSACPFAVRGETPIRSGEDGLASSTEPPNERGMTAMVARHADAVMRMHLLSYESTHGLLARTLAEEVRRRERAEQREEEYRLAHQADLGHRAVRAKTAEFGEDARRAPGTDPREFPRARAYWNQQEGWGTDA